MSEGHRSQLKECLMASAGQLEQKSHIKLGHNPQYKIGVCESLLAYMWMMKCTNK